MVADTSCYELSRHSAYPMSADFRAQENRRNTIRRSLDSFNRPFGAIAARPSWCSVPMRFTINPSAAIPTCLKGRSGNRPVRLACILNKIERRCD